MMARDPGNNPSSSDDKAARPARSLGARLSLYTIFVLLLLAFGIWVWKELSVRKVEQEMGDQRIEMEKEQQTALEAQARAMLQLTAMPLAWAVRSEMMQGNLSQINDYFGDFVREKGVQSIFLIDKENKVVLATNRKLETLPADQVVSQSIRDAESVQIEKHDSVLRLGVPIMSLNEKLGVLVVDYTAGFSDTGAPAESSKPVTFSQ